MSLYITVSATIQAVGAGGSDQRRQPPAAELAGGAPLRAAALPQPRPEVRPPATRLGTRAGEPRLRIGRGVGVEPVAGLGVAGRVHQGGDVPAGGQHEPAVPTEQTRGAVAVLPRGDVVGYPGDDVR